MSGEYGPVSLCWTFQCLTRYLAYAIQVHITHEWVHKEGTWEGQVNTGRRFARPQKVTASEYVSQAWSWSSLLEWWERPLVSSQPTPGQSDGAEMQPVLAAALEGSVMSLLEV